MRSFLTTDYHDHLILCPSLLGKSTKFVTADSYLLRCLRILQETDCPHLMIRGNCGVGKKTLMLHSWRVRNLSRPLVRSKGQFVSRKSQLDKLLIDADGGDLFIDSIDCLSAELREHLVVASNNVRVIATAPPNYQSSDCFLVIDVPPLQERCKDLPLIISYLADRLGKKISVELASKLRRSNSPITTGKLYLLVVNLALLGDRLGQQTIDQIIVDEVLTYRDDELLQNYFVFFTARVGLPQLLDSLGLREVCRLSEHAYIHSSMVENGYNISRVSQALSVPLATLSRKVASLNARWCR